MRIGAVAQDQWPSMSSRAKEIFFPTGILRFFQNPKSAYGISLAPYAHLRCCLYMAPRVRRNEGAVIASIYTG